MDISIITITFNNFEELVETLSSTENLGCERVVVNGGSCRKTSDFLNSRNDIISLSEPDKGISDAFNKGVRLSTKTGLWFLNSGDICQDTNFPKFASEHIHTHSFIYSNITFNSPFYGKICIKPTPYRPLGLGMPYPHQGMIFNKNVFEKLGMFKLDYKITMDFELLCRILNSEHSSLYYPYTTALMDGTGISSTNYKKAHYEIGQALRENRLFSVSNLLSYHALGAILFAKEKLETAGLFSHYRNLKRLIIKQ